MNIRRVIMIHNRYAIPGGEEAVVSRERTLLERAGVEVRLLERDSGTIPRGGIVNSIALAAGAIWNRDAVELVKEVGRSWKPDVIHVHNTQPLFSPAVHHAASTIRIPSIQSIHNYRLFCLNGLALRNGRECIDCLGKSPIRGVFRRCYRRSFAASVGAAGIVAAHRRLATWTRHVALVSVPSAFAAELIRRAGLPASRIVRRPQVLEGDPGVGAHDDDFLLYVGRLSEEKGVELFRDRSLLEALPLPLHVCGEGPLLEPLREVAGVTKRLVIHGRVERQAVTALMKRARLLIMPSRVFEVAPLALIEALATGLPAVVANRGAIPEHVHPGGGWMAGSDQPESWLETIRRAVEDREEWLDRSRSARRLFLERHSAEAGLEALLTMYDRAKELRPTTNEDGR